MSDFQRIPEDKNWVVGRDYAAKDGQRTHTERIKQLAARQFRKKEIDYMPSLPAKGGAVAARIDFERWLVDCPDPDCGGAEPADYDEPLFFCVSCGNAANKGHYYPISFPGQAERKDIYEELDKRPLKRPRQKNKVVRAERSVGATHPALSRSWSPGESRHDLKQQRQFIEQMAKRKK